MSVSQKQLMEVFIKTIPTTPVGMDRAQSIRELYAEGRVEFFVGDDQQVRVRLLEPTEVV